VATRLYFTASEAAPANPSPDGGWAYLSEFVRRKLANRKGSSPVSLGSRIGPWASGSRALDRQYVSSPLAVAQSINGRAKCYLQVREAAAEDNVDSVYLKGYVVSNDGLTVRGVFLALNRYGTVSEFVASPSSPRSKQVVPALTSITTVNAQAGDRIVLEIGYSNLLAGTTPEAEALWGESASDCPENETTTITSAGWFEFETADLLFGYSGSANLSGSAALSAEALVISHADAELVGAATLAGEASAIFTEAADFAGVGALGAEGRLIVNVGAELPGHAAVAAAPNIISFEEAELAGAAELTALGHLLVPGLRLPPGLPPAVRIPRSLPPALKLKRR
jgi:hypothetical protein